MKHNLLVFEDAKSKFPLLRRYINGEINNSPLHQMGINDLARFHDFLKNLSNNNISPLMPDLTWRKLKPILISETKVDRFKTFLKNRTENKFKEILNDSDKYSRLTYGRVVKRASRRRGERRGGECISAFDSCKIHMINYIINSKITVCSNIIGTEYYTTKLQIPGNIDILNNQISNTEKLADKISKFIDIQGDIRDINIDYLSEFIKTKFSTILKIENGSSLRAREDFEQSGSKALTKGKSYMVSNSTIRSGYLNVEIVDDRGRVDYYKYSRFENISLKRNSLLDDLLGED
jgi:hypothetical protein